MKWSFVGGDTLLEVSEFGPEQSLKPNRTGFASNPPFFRGEMLNFGGVSKSKLLYNAVAHDRWIVNMAITWKQPVAVDNSKT